MEFVDRFLKCSDCGQDFIFTAGEQLFFHDKQFKNDPKRCKLCKAKRAGLGRNASADSPMKLPLSRTETRTECSACGVETTVPFKPTQGRPVLCRSCFQLKRVPTAVAAVAVMDSPQQQIAAASEALDQSLAAQTAAAQAIALDEAAAEALGTSISSTEPSPSSVAGLVAETPVAVTTEVDTTTASRVAVEVPQA